MYVFVFTDSSIKQQQQQQAAIFSRWEDDRFKNQNRRDPALESAGIHRPGAQTTPRNRGTSLYGWGEAGRCESRANSSRLELRLPEVAEKRPSASQLLNNRMMGELNAKSGLTKTRTPMTRRLRHECLSSSAGRDPHHSCDALQL